MTNKGAMSIRVAGDCLVIRMALVVMCVFAGNVMAEPATSRGSVSSAETLPSIMSEAIDLASAGRLRELERYALSIARDYGYTSVIRYTADVYTLYGHAGDRTNWPGPAIDKPLREAYKWFEIERLLKGGAPSSSADHLAHHLPPEDVRYAQRQAIRIVSGLAR